MAASQKLSRCEVRSLVVNLGMAPLGKFPVSWAEEQEGNIAEVDWPGADLCISLFL